jgi:hypothetical protein
MASINLSPILGLLNRRSMKTMTFVVAAVLCFGIFYQGLYVRITSQSASVWRRSEQPAITSPLGEHQTSLMDMYPHLSAAQNPVFPVDEVISIIPHNARNRTIAQLKMMADYGAKSLTVKRAKKV